MVNVRRYSIHGASGIGNPFYEEYYWVDDHTPNGRKFSTPWRKTVGNPGNPDVHRPNLQEDHCLAGHLEIADSKCLGNPNLFKRLTLREANIAGWKYGRFGLSRCISGFENEDMPTTNSQGRAVSFRAGYTGTSFFILRCNVYHHNNPSRTHPPQNAPPSRAISGTRDALEGDRGNDLVPGSFQKPTQVVSPSTSYSLDGGHPTATWNSPDIAMRTARKSEAITMHPGVRLPMLFCNGNDRYPPVI